MSSAAILNGAFASNLSCYDPISSYGKLNYQSPVVQSIVSLMSLLVVKVLIITVLVSTISNSQVFLLKKKM